MDYLTHHMIGHLAYLILTTNVLTYMHVTMVYMCRLLVILLQIATETNGGNVSKQPL